MRECTVQWGILVQNEKLFENVHAVGGNSQL